MSLWLNTTLLSKMVLLFNSNTFLSQFLQVKLNVYFYGLSWRPLSFCLYLTIVYIKWNSEMWSYSQSSSGVVHVSSYSETICWICQISWHSMLYCKFHFYGWIPGFQPCFFASLFASVVPWRTFNIRKTLKGVQKVFQITKMFFLLR